MACLTKQDVGACGCGGGGGNLLWGLSGCSGVLTAAVIDVWLTAAKTIYVGGSTDDGGGNYHLASATGGSRYIEISPPSARLALYADTFTYTLNVRRFITLSPAAGYHCGPACVLPIKDTLTLTDPVWGAVTLTWSSGTTWIGSKTVNFAGTGAGCLSCAAKTGVQITYTYNASTGAITLGWPDFAGCPFPGSGGVSITPSVSSRTLVCPPSFSDTVVLDTHLNVIPLWNCPASLTFVVTE